VADEIRGKDAREEQDGLMEPEEADRLEVLEPGEAAVATAGTEGGEPLEAAAQEHAPGVEQEPEAEDELDNGEELVEEEVVVVRRGAFVGGIVLATAVILALAAFGVYQWRRPTPAVATVNGATISRKQYDTAVARGDGQQILDGLVSRQLVQQDAAKHKVSVTNEEIDAKLKDTKSQFPSDADYQRALTSQHLTELDLRDSIRLQLLVEKLTADKTGVSDDEIQQFFDQNKDTQFAGKSLTDVKDQIKSQLTDQKQQDAVQSYIDDLRRKAKISTHLPGG
jgi:hypothetical protein